LIALADQWIPPKFPLTAKDFMERGVKQGPALGAALARAEADWIAADFTMDAMQLKQIVDRSAK
jgi:poly(A) polymerase